MDKLNHYRQLICNCLTQYTQIKPTLGDIEVFKFFDLERDHYQRWSKTAPYGASQQEILSTLITTAPNATIQGVGHAN